MSLLFNCEILIIIIIVDVAFNGNIIISEWESKRLAKIGIEPISFELHFIELPKCSSARMFNMPRNIRTTEMINLILMIDESFHVS